MLIFFINVYKALNYPNLFWICFKCLNQVQQYLDNNWIDYNDDILNDNEMKWNELKWIKKWNLNENLIRI